MARPLRHLEYLFSIDAGGVTDYHYNGIPGSDLRPSSGVGGAAVSQGARGTMYVDVLSIASDGALMVKISELVQNAPRAGQAYTCTVYGNTTVVCPSVPAPTAAEWALLAYLGRNFVDGAPWDADHHWRRTQETPQDALVEDFTMDGAADAKLVVVREKKTVEMHNGGFGNRTEQIEITYNRSMEVPDAVHDEIDSSGGGGSSHTVFDFHLSSDSFATKTH